MQQSQLTVEVPHLLLPLLQLQHLCIYLPDLSLHLTHLHTQLVQVLLLGNGVPVSGSNTSTPVHSQLRLQRRLEVCRQQGRCTTRDPQRHILGNGVPIGGRNTSTPVESQLHLQWRLEVCR